MVDLVRLLMTTRLRTRDPALTKCGPIDDQLVIVAT